MKRTALRTVGRLSIIALLASVNGCRCTPEVDDVDTRDESLPAGTTNGSQVAPQPVLASMWIPESIHPHRLNRQPWAQRILADGTLWSYTDELDRVDPESKELRYEPVPLAWWFQGERITPRDLRILADAIRTLHLMDLPTDPPAPTETLMGTGETTWTFSVDGRPPHDVTAFHGQPRPGLDAFDRLFVDAYTNAGQRWLRDRGRPFAPLEPLGEP